MKRELLHICRALLLLAACYGIIEAQAPSADPVSAHTLLEQTVLSHYTGGKPFDALALQMISDEHVSSSELEQYRTELSSFVEGMTKKREKFANDKKFLSYLFYKVHQKYLKQYQPFTSLYSLLSNGKYDCLSGTSLYAVMLNMLHIKYSIVEMNYHIYLKIEDQPVLFESTDPLSGFISDRGEIAKRLHDYEEGNISGVDQGNTKGEKDYVRFNFKLNNTIHLEELAGLHYYNAAVVAYNQQQLIESVDNLEKTVIFYKSPRVTELGSMIVKALFSTDRLNDEEKRWCMSRVTQLLKADPAVASR